MKSDLHPYECGQDCIHCRKELTSEHVPLLCEFCWDDLLALFTIDLCFRVPVQRQLRSHGMFAVMHSGQEYGPYAAGEAASEYLRDEMVGRLPAYRFKLTGAHFGPPIEVLMVEPQWEGDSYGGVYYCWTRLLWADDQSDFQNEYFDDAYTDALRDELTEIAKGWD